MINTAGRQLEDHDLSGSTARPCTLPGWCLLFAAGFALYAMTADRGAQWQDSGEHIWRILTGHVLNARGLALSHPLHYDLGRLAIWPGLLAPALAVTLISALGGALAVANTYGAIVTCTRRHAPALFGACSLAVAHTVWQLATRAETYTLGIALLSGELWALLLLARDGRARWALILLALNGLGIANHMQASLTTPVVFAVVGYLAYRRRLTMRTVVLGLALWVVGTLPYTTLVCSQMIQTGDVSATISSALFGKRFAPAVLNATPSTRQLAVTASFFLLSFPNLLLPAAVIGIVQFWRRRRESFAHVAILAALVLHAGFAVRYDVVDQYTFFLPTYTLLCLLGGIGFAHETGVGRRRRRAIGILAFVLLATTPVVYAFAPTVARRLGVLEGIARDKPYRDDYAYLLTPWSVSETSAEHMSTEAIKLAGKDGLIIAEDGMAKPALLYHRRLSHLPDLDIVTAHELDENPGVLKGHHQAVYVPRDRDRPHLPPAWHWTRHGDLYVGKR